MGSQRVGHDLATKLPPPQWLGLSTFTAEVAVQSLDWEDPLEKEMATLSNILTWEILWTEEPGGLQSTGLQSDTTEQLGVFNR